MRPVSRAVRGIANQETMDEINSPVLYEDLDIEGLKAHLRYLTFLERTGHCAEIYLKNLGVAIPIAKKIYKTKSDQLVFLLRSGSISRDNLTDLKDIFVKQRCDITAAYTAKKKLIKRLSLPIKIDDPMLPMIGIGILEKLTLQLKSNWPCKLSIGYAFGDENNELPGTLKYQDLIAQAGYKIGQAVGRAKKLILP